MRGWVVGLNEKKKRKSFVRPSEPPAGTPRELVHQVKQKNRFNPAGRAGESALIGANKNEEGYDFLDRNKSLSRKGFRRGRGIKTYLPDRIMFNVHPQRWHDAPLPWVKAPVKFAKAGTVVP